MKEGKNNASNLQFKNQSNKKTWASHLWGRFAKGTNYSSWRSWFWVEPVANSPAGRTCCTLRCKWTKQNWIQVIKKDRLTLLMLLYRSGAQGGRRNWLGMQSQLALSSSRLCFCTKAYPASSSRFFVQRINHFSLLWCLMLPPGPGAAAVGVIVRADRISTPFPLGTWVPQSPHRSPKYNVICRFFLTSVQVWS